MAVLAREIDAYNRALEAYKRQVGTYDRSIVTDANGNPVILYAGSYYAVPKDGSDPYVIEGTYNSQYNQYGAVASESDPNVLVLRQNPTNTTTKQVQLMYATDEGGGYYYTVDAQGQQTGIYSPDRTTQITQNPDGTYTATEYTYDYVTKPTEAEQQGLLRKRPDPTLAQMKKLGQPSLAAQERGGLLGDVIRGNGLASGIGRGTVSSTPQQPAPEPEQPVEPPPPIEWFDPGGTGGL